MQIRSLEVSFVLIDGQTSNIGQAGNLLALTTERANALLSDKAMIAMPLFKCLMKKKALNPSFRLAATELVCKFATGLRIKSII